MFPLYVGLLGVVALLLLLRAQRNERRKYGSHIRLRVCTGLSEWWVQCMDVYSNVYVYMYVLSKQTR